MSDNNSTIPAPENEGENTPQTEKKSLWARAKARKARFVSDHPFAAECGRQVAYGAAYVGGILAITVVYGAVTGKSSDEDAPELESAESTEDDILSDEE